MWGESEVEEDARCCVCENVGEVSDRVKWINAMCNVGWEWGRWGCEMLGWVIEWGGSKMKW